MTFTDDEDFEDIDRVRVVVLLTKMIAGGYVVASVANSLINAAMQIGGLN